MNNVITPPADDTVSSDSENEAMNIDGMLAVKDIEKLTGGNLNLKPLDIDLHQMRAFVHTPKDGITMPIDTANFIA